MNHGPVRSPRRIRCDEIVEKYGLVITRRRRMRDIPQSLIDQIDRCKSEEAKRLILGVSK